MRKRTARGRFLIAFGLLLSCTDSGTEPPEPPLPTMLQGRLERANVIIEANTTVTVTGDLLLKAKHVRIDGTMIVSPTANVVLFAEDSLIFTGTITAPEPETTEQSSVARSAAASHTGFTGGQESLIPLFLMGGRDLRFHGGATSLGHNALLTGTSEGGDIQIINGYIDLRAGPNGTPDHPQGYDGPFIEIGTAVAREEFEFWWGPGSSGPVKRLHLQNADLNAGTGGRGLELVRELARQVGNRLEGISGDGGPGGYIRIVTEEISLDNSVIQPGDGGLSGWIDLTLRNGSGPDGEGESAEVSLGSGGPSGSLEIIATTVLAGRAVKAGQPGRTDGFRITGGNGVDGGDGGSITVYTGAPGQRGTLTMPPGIVEVPFTGGFADFQALLTDAANGGASLTPGKPGGSGGTIAVFGRQPNSLPYLNIVALESTGNGGYGFNGCLQAPKRDGTNGGLGGVRRIPPGITIDDYAANFNGGGAGDGVTPGKGGERGTDAYSNQPLGARGLDGSPCPTFASFVSAPSVFQNMIGSTPCPQLVGTAVILNPTQSTASFEITGSGLPGVTFVPATGVLTGGQSLSIAIVYDCSQSNSFSGEMRLSGTANGETTEVSRPLAANLTALVVVLDYTLGPFAAGSEIELSRVKGSSAGSAHGPNCLAEHLHAATNAGITIDGLGPFPDPNELGCGYGLVNVVQR